MFINKDKILEIKNYKLLGAGSEAHCYINNNEVYKLYDFSIRERLTCLGYESKLIAFPKEEYRSKIGHLLGYKMNYMNGIYFDKGFDPNTNLEDLKNAYLELLDELYKVCPDINTLDMAFKHNMLFDGKHFSVIDTDRWIKWGKFDSKHRLNKTLLRAFKKSILIMDKKIIKNNPELVLLNQEINNKYYPLDLASLIDVIKNFYIEAYGFEPEVIDDINEVLVK